MVVTRTEELKILLRKLDPMRPVDDPSLYVERRDSVSRYVAQRVNLDPASTRKYLLVGGPGSGKSTELYNLASSLSMRNELLTVTIDLDRSGILASNISAFDLVYLAARQLLRKVPGTQHHSLLRELARAYDPKFRPSKSATADETADTLAEFSILAGTTAEALGGLPGGSVGTGAVARLVGKGIKLLPGRPIVSESSPQGRALLEVCSEITRQARLAAKERPVYVFVDGLEKMNGEAPQRFREVFVETLLLMNCPFGLVVAAPPCTLTSVDGAGALGYEVRPVMGFAGDTGSTSLASLFRKRAESVHLAPDEVLGDDLCDMLAQASGGIPRHFVQLLRESLTQTLLRNALAVSSDDADGAIRALGEELNRGLDEQAYQALAVVLSRGLLPTHERVPSLFGTARILALPPDEATHAHKYRVHPLLEAAVRAVK